MVMLKSMCVRTGEVGCGGASAKGGGSQVGSLISEKSRFVREEKGREEEGKEDLFCCTAVIFRWCDPGQLNYLIERLEIFGRGKGFYPMYVFFL